MGFEAYALSYMSNLKAKKKLLNHLAYLRRKGLVLSKEEFAKIAIRYTPGAVLTLRFPEKGWTIDNLCWKEMSWFKEQRLVDGFRLYQSSGRWYSKKYKGSWRSREEAVAYLKSISAL